MLRDLWMEGGGETYCLRTKHLPQKLPSHPFPPPFRPVSFSPSLDPVHLPLWYRFTRDLATDDGIERKKEKKRKREKKRKERGSMIDESGSRVKIIF